MNFFFTFRCFFWTHTPSHPQQKKSDLLSFVVLFDIIIRSFIRYRTKIGRFFFFTKKITGDIRIYIYLGVWDIDIPILIEKKHSLWMRSIAAASIPWYILRSKYFHSSYYEFHYYYVFLLLTALQARCRYYLSRHSVKKIRRDRDNQHYLC